MPEESTPPDLLKISRRIVEATGKGDKDETMAFYAPDAVWDASPMGIGTFERQAAVRGFCEDWVGSDEDRELQVVDVQDLGNAVSLSVLVQNGRPVRSSGEVTIRCAAVTTWEDGRIARVTNYIDIDEARAAAERLAKERE
jgi:ketosteroid isomerase-like protein